MSSERSRASAGSCGSHPASTQRSDTSIASARRATARRTSSGSTALRARDLALAAGALTTEGEARRRWIQLGLACDLANAAAGYIAGRTGVLPKPAAIMVTGVALLAAGLGAGALAADGDEAAAPA
jgi:hypothetical protein